MREAAARMIETPTAIIALALAVGLGMGIGFAAVVELKQMLIPYKPTSELCKALAP
jgi:hypothetical protein